MPKKINKKTVRRWSFVVLRNHISTFFLQFVTKSSSRTKLLLSLGFLLVTIPTFFYINEGIQLAFFTPKVTAVSSSLPAPTWISIPSIDMELPIVETALKGNTWGIADNGISHLNISARPGEEGPIILYGHNTNDRFGPIRWLEVGKEITLTNERNRSRQYKVIKTLEVSPSEVSVLLSQKGETLILYTCDGFADLQRFIVIAKPV
ncbi:MAG TPA: sortase [Candidatus Eisenbacteria bacterium]|nr:sortase [Candidatus Eisenbacteria bacterium]